MHPVTANHYASVASGVPCYQKSSGQPLYVNCPAPVTAVLTAHGPLVAKTLYLNEPQQISQFPSPYGYQRYIAGQPDTSIPDGSQQPAVQAYQTYPTTFQPSYVPSIPDGSQQPTVQAYQTYPTTFQPSYVPSIPDGSQQPAVQTDQTYYSHVTPAPSSHSASQQPLVQTCHQTYASHQALVSSMSDHRHQPCLRQSITAPTPTRTDPVGPEVGNGAPATGALEIVLQAPQPRQLYASPVQSMTTTASVQQPLPPLNYHNDVTERQTFYSTRESQLALLERIIQQLRAANNPIVYCGDVPEIWNAKVKEYFGRFSHDFRAEPVGANDLDLLKASCIFYSDKAKVRFRCQTCQNDWTSMKGRVEFYVSDPRISSTEDGVMKRVEVVRYKLFGQDCLECPATERRESRPKWYQEEIDKVVLNLSFHIEKVVYGAQNVPEPINENRAGRPRTYRSRDGCQACKEGLACPAYRPSSNFQPHQNPTRPQPVSTDASPPKM